MSGCLPLCLSFLSGCCFGVSSCLASLYSRFPVIPDVVRHTIRVPRRSRVSRRTTRARSAHAARVSRGQASTRMSRARSDHATYQPNMYYPDRARRTRLARPSPPKASALAPHFESTQPCRVWVRVAGVRMLARRARPEAPWSRRALSPCSLLTPCGSKV